MLHNQVLRSPVIFTSLLLLLLAGCSSASGTEQPTRSATDTAATPPAPPVPGDQYSLRFLGRYRHGGFNQSAAEISAYDVASRRVFVVNAEIAGIDILDLSQPAQLKLVASVSLTKYGSKPNSVAAQHGMVAVAVSANPKQDPGCVVFLDVDGHVLRTVKVGSEPDMLTFTPDGHWLLTANEGEPTDDYTRDPEGSVSLINVQQGALSVSQDQVTTLGLSAWNDPAQRDPLIRVYGPQATAAQDFEPEYIAVAPDSKTAWVVLQEANAIATLDLVKQKLTKVTSLGFKDHSLPENALDVSDQDGGIQIRNWPVKGMYQPDSIQAFTSQGELFLISANEGDHRKFAGYSEETRVADLKLDPLAFPNAAELQRPENLGRLLVTKANGDANSDGLYEELYCLGARSFSVWNEQLQLVADSGSEFERIVAAQHPEFFNTDHESHKLDGRSDNKGPEPEGLCVGEINGRQIAFIGLERDSGIVVYDLHDPRRPQFQSYISTRDFTQPAKEATAGDLGPEGLKFIPAKDSPTGTPLLVVTFEVSSTTAVFEVVVAAK